MRIALYRPPDPAADPYPFGDSRLADLVGRALTAAAHDLVRIPVRLPDDEAAVRQSDRGATAEVEVRWLVDYLRSAPRPPPDLWISLRVSGRAPDQIGPAVSAALHIPYVLLQPSGPDAGDADALRRAIAAANATIVFSNALAESMRRLLPEHGDRLTVLPPFIDMNEVVAAGRGRAVTRAGLAAKHRLTPDAPWVIAAGPMATGPQVDSFRAVARAMALAVTVDWQLIVAGAGPRRGDIENIFRAAPRRLDRHVSITSPEELSTLLAAGDLFLWPSIDEHLSPTAVEAQAAGLAVVGSRSGAMLDIVADGETGMLTKPDNGASFANAVSFLLRQPDFRREFSKKAPKWAGANFDISVVAPRLDAVLRRIKNDFRGGEPRTMPPAVE